MMKIDHADIVVTHKCKFNCKNCIDKFRNSCTELTDLSYVDKFLKLLRKHTKERLSILLLGGEPTEAGILYLSNITKLIHIYGFKVVMSTNGANRPVINECLRFMDWVQITIHNEKELEYWKQSKCVDKINVKLPGDESLTIEKLDWFINSTKEFGRRSLTMYFTPDFKNLCKDENIFNLLSELNWYRLGSYMYTFYQGVRIKTFIPNETNIIDEPLIPKLYPNGNYNKSWCHEDMDDYLGSL